MIIKNIKAVLNKGYEAQKCSICNQRFTLLLRIHKCKRCQRFICYSCGKHNEHYVQTDGELSASAHRVCVLCKEDIDEMKDTITKFDMRWGKPSVFTKEWRSQMGECESNFQSCMRLFYQNQAHYSESADIIEKDVMLGRTDYKVFNYSLREFFFKVQKDKSTESVRKNMANVLYAVTSRFPTMGYCQGMSSIAAFLLSFGSEEDTFDLFCDLIDKILPPGLYNHSHNGMSLIGLLSQIHYIKKRFFFFLEIIKDVKTQEEGRDRLLSILDLIGSKCILTLFVNNMAFKNLMFFWDRLRIQRSFAVIDKTMIAIMYLFNESIQHAETHYKFIQRYIEIMDPDAFKQIYNEVTIDLEERKMIIDEFYKGMSSEWNKETKMNSNKLSKISKFTQKEIEGIRKVFSTIIEQSEEKLGLELEGWLKLMDILTKKEGYRRLISLGGTENGYFQRIFAIFDEENNGVLDFREFICGVSILLRGTLKEKLILHIQSLKDSNKCISHRDFEKTTKMLVSTIHNLFQQDQQLLSLQQMFKQRVNKYSLQRDKIMLNEIHVLVNNDYIDTATIRSMQDKNQQIVEDLIDSLTLIIK